MSTALGLDFTVLEELEESLEIPCDYNDNTPSWPVQNHGPARWVGHTKCPECGVTGQRLLCTACKDIVISTDGGCYCGHCESRIVPFRAVFVRFEAL